MNNQLRVVDTHNDPILFDDLEDDRPDLPDRGGHAKPSGASTPRIDTSYTTRNYRALAGSEVVLTEDQRITMVYIAMWLASQPTKNGAMLRGKIYVAEIANSVLWCGANPATVPSTLFPDLDHELLARKASCLLRICRAPRELSPAVIDLAYCHASTKANLSLVGIVRLEAYVTRLLMELPTEDQFTTGDWFEDFT